MSLQIAVKTPCNRRKVLTKIFLECGKLQTGFHGSTTNLIRRSKWNDTVHIVDPHKSRCIRTLEKRKKNCISQEHISEDRLSGKHGTIKSEFNKEHNWRLLCWHFHIKLVCRTANCWHQQLQWIVCTIRVSSRVGENFVYWEVLITLMKCHPAYNAKQSRWLQSACVGQ